ncbi:MAG: DHHW family protein [Gemmiger sp.]
MEKNVYRKRGRTRIPASLTLFAVLLCGFTLLNVFWPKREFSELENRKLAQMPSFSVKAVLNGQWQKNFSTYMQDQVALRDRWIDLESAVNSLVFGKTEEGGILLGNDSWMFTRLFTGTESENAQLEKNVKAVSSFASRYPGRVTFLLAPSASNIYPEMLPAHAPMIAEDAMLDDIFSSIGQSADVIDLRPVYRSSGSSSLYFKTDHHWTPDGAYLAYKQFCELKGLQPFDRNAHTAVSVEDFYGTHYSAARRWNAKPDSFVYFDLPNPMTIYRITGEAQYEPDRTEPLINTDKLLTQDKYGAFLDGNNGYSVIEGDGQGSILVVKDSYANSFVPYLTANYAKIGVVDFRSFAYGLDSTIEAEGYDQILILYNFQTFISDTHVIYIDRPTTLK